MNEKRILLKHLPEIIVSIFDYNGDNERITDFWCEFNSSNLMMIMWLFKMLHISKCPRRAILVLELKWQTKSWQPWWLIYTIAAIVTKFNWAQQTTQLVNLDLTRQCTRPWSFLCSIITCICCMTTTKCH